MNALFNSSLPTQFVLKHFDWAFHLFLIDCTRIPLDLDDYERNSLPSSNTEVHYCYKNRWIVCLIEFLTCIHLIAITIPSMLWE